MISPFLYRDGDFLSPALAARLLPLGLVLLPLWMIGMVRLFRKYHAMFLIIAVTYVYFFAAFGWFSVNGRLILTFSFQSILVYLLGLEWITTGIRTRIHKPVSGTQNTEVA